MKNKFTIAEGEVQRILGLHKQAILKENKIILSEVYGLNLINATNGADEKWYLKSFKVSKKNGDILTATVVDSDDSKFSNIEINCKTKNILTIKSDGTGSYGHQHNGTTYRLGNDLVAIITKACSGTNKSNEGSSNLDGNKNTKTSYTTKQWNELELNTYNSGQGFRYAIPKGTVFSLTDTKGVLRAKKAALYTAMSGPGKEWGKGSETSVSFFCKQGKFYIKGYKDKNFYSSALAKALVNSICNVDPSKVVAKKEVNGTSEYKSKKDTKDKPNNNPNNNPNVNPKVKGNRYTFDFDAIMKAINDTGKCAGSWGSSDGTNGTSGTQGTSGTNGIQNPIPINNKISKELYYTIIAN